MAFCIRLLSTAALLLSAGAASGQQAPIVQPGAPGESNKTLSAATAAPVAKVPTKADIDFMQGMVHHHSQAVEMVELLKTRGRDKALQLFGQRISISQTDEIEYMKQWLRDHGQPEPMDHAHMGHNMASMPLMPGMLTPEQMKALAKARGSAFDHLFLTGMIQHHTGALIMVDELFATPGAAQDNVLYDFATDIDNTQQAEIRIMQGMLSKEKK